MDLLFNGDPFARSSAQVPARDLLAQLGAWMGTTGLIQARLRPGLQAEVDQHAAAIRDGLDGSLGPASLAGYAEGLYGAATEAGWESPQERIDWSVPDWVLIRLLAVYWLHRDRDRQNSRVPAPR